MGFAALYPSYGLSSISPHERSDMRERHVRLAAAPDIAPLIRATFGNTFQPSFPAKAGNPVRRGLSATTPASGILGHPPSRVTTSECRRRRSRMGAAALYPSCGPSSNSCVARMSGAICGSVTSVWRLARPSSPRGRNRRLRALCDKFFVQPATAVVAPPNLSAHQPAGNAASRHDDPP